MNNKYKKTFHFTLSFLLATFLGFGMVSCGLSNNATSNQSSHESMVTSNDETFEEISSDESNEETSNNTSSETNDHEVGQHIGYYLVGEFVENKYWNTIFKYEGFEQYKLTQDPNNENIYTIIVSITDELIESSLVDNDTPNALDYKVCYYDGNARYNVEWYPDGIYNYGLIYESGEYLFTFNIMSNEIIENGDFPSYIKYTTHERIGGCKSETTFTLGEEIYIYNKVYEKVTINVTLEEGLELPENYSVYLFMFDLWIDNNGNTYYGLYECQLDDGVWTYTTSIPVVVDDGDDYGVESHFCIIVDEKGITEETINWDKKINNSSTTDTNFSIKIDKNVHDGTVQIKFEDQPYWLLINN